jgi:hypothetical protein
MSAARRAAGAHRDSGHVRGAAWLWPAADVTPSRIMETLDVLAFELTDDIAKIAALDNNWDRVGPDLDLFA